MPSRNRASATPTAPRIRANVHRECTRLITQAGFMWKRTSLWPPPRLRSIWGRHLWLIRSFLAQVLRLSVPERADSSGLVQGSSNVMAWKVAEARTDPAKPPDNTVNDKRFITHNWQILLAKLKKQFLLNELGRNSFKSYFYVPNQGALRNQFVEDHFLGKCPQINSCVYIVFKRQYKWYTWTCKIEQNKSSAYWTQSVVVRCSLKTAGKNSVRPTPVMKNKPAKRRSCQ